MLLVVCLFGFAIAALNAAPTTETGAVAAAAASSSVQPVPIIQAESNVDSISGNYNYRYESGDGSKAEQTGQLKEIEKGKFGETVQGSYEYTDPEGNRVFVSYIADENGYQPQSNFIPQAPPIPEQISRALKFNEEHPYVDESTAKTTNNNN